MESSAIPPPRSGSVLDLRGMFSSVTLPLLMHDESRLSEDGFLDDLRIQFLPEVATRLAALLEALEIAIADRSPERLETLNDVAHTMYGSLGSFGFVTESDLAGDIEQYLGAGSVDAGVLKIYRERVRLQLAKRTEAC